MNFLDKNFGDGIAGELNALEQSHRMPHAVIITGGDKKSREDLCNHLCMWAVCSSQGEKPCGVCNGCTKCKSSAHVDVYYAKGTGKTDSISVEEIRNITRDTAIIPNEADNKVYVLWDADKRMGGEALNAFLKTLEEPPKGILFLLTAENPKSLPETIRSRCATLTLDSVTTISEETKELAKEILLGIISVNELDLLKATAVLSTRAKALQVLPFVRVVLSDALALSVSSQALFDVDTASKLRARLTKDKIIKLIDATSDTINKVNRNVNPTLLSTWICGEYRRISWQK